MRSRTGFTAIELITVLFVMAIISTMALPRVMDLIRESAVRDAANAIANNWRTAQLKAMRTRNIPGENKHFGIIIDQGAGQPWCAVIRSDKATPQIDETLGQRHYLGRSIHIEVHNGNNAIIPNPFTIGWYAQFATGRPILGSKVAAGLGASAPAVGIGLGDTDLIRSPYRLIRVMSLDFDENTDEGHAYDIQLLPTGTVMIREWDD